MILRTTYLAGLVTHREYYGQFVTEGIKNIVRRRFRREIVAGLPVEEWATIGKWDSFGLPTPGMIAQLRAAGDVNPNSKSNAVCVYKEAARQIMDEFTEKA